MAGKKSKTKNTSSMNKPVKKKRQPNEFIKATMKARKDNAKEFKYKNKTYYAMITKTKMKVFTSNKAKALASFSKHK